jgi:hypothetical protein
VLALDGQSTLIVSDVVDEEDGIHDTLQVFFTISDHIYFVLSNACDVARLPPS